MFSLRCRYQCLTKRHGIKSNREQVVSVIKELHVPDNEWQVGTSKVFLRSVAHEPLEDARKQMIISRAIIIQTAWRRFHSQNQFRRTRSAVLRIQHAFKGWRSRIDFLRKRRAAIVIQSHLRGVFAREVAHALREMRRVEEEMRKRERLEAERKERERLLSEQQAEEERKALEECERYVFLSLMKSIYTHFHRRLIFLKYFSVFSSIFCQSEKMFLDDILRWFFRLIR